MDENPYEAPQEKPIDGPPRKLPGWVRRSRPYFWIAMALLLSSLGVGRFAAATEQYWLARVQLVLAWAAIAAVLIGVVLQVIEDRLAAKSQAGQ